MHLPKTEAGTPERAPANSPLGVSEATVSVPDELTMAITVTEACKRKACDVGARRMDLTEEATQPETNRRALWNFQPDVTEAIASAADNLTMPITVSEAGQRNACDV